MKSTKFNDEYAMVAHPFFMMIFVTICKYREDDFYESRDYIVNKIFTTSHYIRVTLNFIYNSCTFADMEMREHIIWIKRFHDGFDDKVRYVIDFSKLLVRNEANKRSEYSRLHNLMADYIKICLMFIDVHVNFVKLTFFRECAQSVFRYLLDQSSALVSSRDIILFIENNKNNLNPECVTSEYLERNPEIQTTMLELFWSKFNNPQ